MLRTLGNVLIVVAAVALSVGVAFALLAGLADRIGSDQRLRLTALDTVAREGPAPAVATAVLGEGTGRPPGRRFVLFRFDDGWTGRDYSSRTGLAECPRPGGLPVGRHVFHAHLPERRPTLAAPSSGAVWVRPADRAVLWVDADAAIPRAGKNAAPDAACQTLNVLAKRHGLVYLVSGDLDRYVAVRHCLPPMAGPLPGEAGESGGRAWPDGPPIWVGPGAGPKALARLKATWPDVAGALVAAEDLRPAVSRLGVSVVDVPRAASDVPSQEREVRWRAVLEAIAPEHQRDRPGQEG